MMKRNTARQQSSPPAAFITLPGGGTVRAGTSPSLLPCQGSLSQYVHRWVWGWAEVGRTRRKASGDGAGGEGVNSISNNHRHWQRAEVPTGLRAQGPPHTKTLSSGSRKMGLLLKEEKGKVLFFLSLQTLICFHNGAQSICGGCEAEINGQIRSLFNIQSFFILQGLMADLGLNEKLKEFFGNVLIYEVLDRIYHHSC